MEDKIYSRSVTIRDKNKNRWDIEFKVRKLDKPHIRRDADTLEEFKECFVMSVSENGGFSSGQCYNNIR